MMNKHLTARVFYNFRVSLVEHCIISVMAMLFPSRELECVFLLNFPEGDFTSLVISEAVKIQG